MCKQSKYQLTDKMDKDEVAHTTMYYYLASKKKKEIFQYVTTWINPEDDKVTQSQKAKYCMIVFKMVKLIESESRIVVAEISRRRKWGVANQWA